MTVSNVTFLVTNPGVLIRGSPQHIEGGLTAFSEKNMLTVAVADPGFPRLSGGANPRDKGANLLFWQLFPENCKLSKKKNIVWERHPHPLPHLGFANGYVIGSASLSDGVRICQAGGGGG